MSARVLFASWPFEGHVFPTLSVALAARERGDEVAFYTGSRFRPMIESAGVEVFQFERVEGVWERVQERERGARGRAQSLRAQREAFREWLVESIPAQVADLRKVIRLWSPDAIVTDGSMWGPSLILHEATSIPVVFQSTLIFSLVPGRDVPLPGSRIGKPRSERGLALTWGAARAIDLLATPIRKRIDELRASYGLGPMGCSVNEFCGRLPLYLVGSVPELDYERRDLPPSVRYVGPVTWHPPEPPGTIEWLDQIPTSAPWVHVTEGTSHHQQSFLLQAAALGMANANVEVIATTVRDEEPGRPEPARAVANIHLARWLSHSVLLPRCDVVVTTGGAGTIINALRVGVPLVVVPTGWDKPANAKRVVDAGAGLWLSPRRCTPERLREAVQSVLTQPRYRHAAARIADRLAAAPGPGGAAELIGALVRSEMPAATPAIHGGRQ